MKTKIILFFLLYTLSLSFVSCEKILDIDIPETDKHLVINSFVKPDSLLVLNVSKSMSVLDDGDIPYPDDVVIKLYEDNNFIENLKSVGNGNFTSSVILNQERSYKIVADYPGLPGISADCNFPEKVLIKSVDTSTVEISNSDPYGEYKQTQLNLKIKISDPEKDDNYYMLAISIDQPVYDYNKPDTTGTPVIIGYEPQYIWFEGSEFIFDYDYFTISGIFGQTFTDGIFNGKDFSIDVGIDISNMSETSSTPKIKVVLLSLSKELYTYIDSFNKSNSVSGNPFAQPVQIYTNIKNGLGIFGSYNIDVFEQ